MNRFLTRFIHNLWEDPPTLLQGGVFLRARELRGLSPALVPLVTSYLVKDLGHCPIFIK
jgi:hypothetical protein